MWTLLSVKVVVSIDSYSAGIVIEGLMRERQLHFALLPFGQLWLKILG